MEYQKTRPDDGYFPQHKPYVRPAAEYEKGQETKKVRREEPP